MIAAIVYSLGLLISAGVMGAVLGHRIGKK